MGLGKNATSTDTVIQPAAHARIVKTISASNGRHCEPPPTS
jgi:hypothetical protein